MHLCIPSFVWRSRWKKRNKESAALKLHVSIQVLDVTPELRMAVSERKISSRILNSSYVVS